MNESREKKLIVPGSVPADEAVRLRGQGFRLHCAGCHAKLDHFGVYALSGPEYFSWGGHWSLCEYRDHPKHEFDHPRRTLWGRIADAWRELVA